MRYSRLESTEEKRNFRSATILLILSIGVIVLLFIYGIPLVGKVASFVSGLRGGSNSIISNDKTPPVPPSFNTFPDFINQQNISISGTGEPGVIIKLNFEGKSQETQETIVDRDGNFIFHDLTLKEGDNTFNATAVDSAKNVSQPTADRTINYDIKPPDLTIDNPQDGANFFGNTQRQINIQGTSESGVGITINDRIVSVDSNGKFQYPITLNGGGNTYLIKAVDPAGNTTEKSITLNFSE